MASDWGVVARTVHVLAVVVWIGGVWFVTMVLLPEVAKQPPERRLEAFAAIERGFAPQARVAVLLVLLSGLYMLHRYDMWGRFVQPGYWWMHLMVCVWLVFALALFLIEPLAARRLLTPRARASSGSGFARMLWLHRLLLAVSLLAIFAAVGGSHGLF